MCQSSELACGVNGNAHLEMSSRQERNMAAPAAPAPPRPVRNPCRVDLLKECFLHVSPLKPFPLRIHVTTGVCARWVLLLFSMLFSRCWIESLFSDAPLASLYPTPSERCGFSAVNLLHLPEPHNAGTRGRNYEF